MIAVDTSAIMALLLGEPTANRIIQCMADNELCMSAGTLSELSIVSTARGLFDEVEAIIESTAMEIVPVDGSTIKYIQQAYQSWGKGRHKASLNFGDCFSYAVAKERDIPLLFIGNDFSETDLEVALKETE